INGEHGYSNIVAAMLDSKDEFSALIYPNPTSGQVNIRLLQSAAQPVTFRITTLTGQLLLEEQADLDAGNHLHQLSLKGQAAGAYLVSVISKAGTLHTRIIKVAE